MTISSIPRPQLTDTGAALPTEAELLAGAITDLNDAFGGQLANNPASPQSYLAGQIAANVADKNNELLYVLNQSDPTKASGRWQDGFNKFYNLQRKQAQGTVTTCQIMGVEGAYIAAGTIAIDELGSRHEALQSATIDVTGTINLPFVNLEKGAIPCPANTLNKFETAQPGIDRINNEAPGMLGTYEETRAEFESRRKESVAHNGTGTVQALRAKILQLDGVLDAYVKDNPSATYDSVGVTSYLLFPNSLFVCVVGGTSDSIASTIMNYRSPGHPMMGNTIAQVADNTSNYATPPVYNIKFHRPTPVNIRFLVTIPSSALVSSNADDIVTNKILSVFKSKIASKVSAADYYDAVLECGYGLTSIKITSDAVATPDLDAVALGVDQVSVTDHLSIAVQVS